MNKKQQKLYVYAALKKGAKFSLGLSGKNKNYIKFSNAWAKNLKTGDWISMLSTETVLDPVND